METLDVAFTGSAHRELLNCIARILTLHI